MEKLKLVADLLRSLPGPEPHRRPGQVGVQEAIVWLASAASHMEAQQLGFKYNTDTLLAFTLTARLLKDASSLQEAAGSQTRNVS